VIYLIAGAAYGLGVFIAYQMGIRAGMRRAVLIIARVPINREAELAPCLICGEPKPEGVRCDCWTRGEKPC
jgi:hypothetical protein